MRPTRQQVPWFLRGLRKVRILAETWYPWNQKTVAARLHPASIRKLTADDIPWCEELHVRNHRYGVPEDNFANFQSYLRSDKTLILVMEDPHGERIGTFSLHWQNEVMAMLGYLLIDPTDHAKGYGTTAVIAAISLLAKGRGEKFLFIRSLPRALPFYQKIGFQTIDGVPPGEYGMVWAALEEISPLLVLDCVSMLSEAGVTLPDYSDEIPLTPDPTGSAVSSDSS